jgi:hypothetical protein
MNSPENGDKARKTEGDSFWGCGEGFINWGQIIKPCSIVSTFTYKLAQKISFSRK